MKAGAGWSDPQTIADRRAQQLIVKAFHEAFPKLTVVGEEEGLGEAEETAGAAEASAPPAQTSDEAAALAADYPAELRSIPLSELCVWVDPLDGTKEFTKRNFEAVTCLIGITRNEHPVAGVVGCPFVGGGTIAWGVPGVGCFGIPSALKAIPGLVLVRSATQTSELKEVERVLAPADVLGLGATGNKLLRVLEGRGDVFVLCSPGTYRWDTCAGEALLRASGGGLVDRNGDR